MNDLKKKKKKKKKRKDFELTNKFKGLKDNNIQVINVGNAIGGFSKRKSKFWLGNGKSLGNQSKKKFVMHLVLYFVKLFH